MRERRRILCLDTPVDPSGVRRKLDVQWMTGIWVGRLDESVLTPHGTNTGRSVRRLAGNLRVQPDLVEKIKVVFKIQLCLRPNFCRCYLRLYPSDWQEKPTLINWPNGRNRGRQSQG